MFFACGSLMIVQEIEQIIDLKVESKITVLTTKEHLLIFQVDVVKRFSNIILWIVGLGLELLD